MNAAMRRSAVLSDCGLFRYQLDRWWQSGDRLTFVMLNPSTADVSIDDPTIRRCTGFALRDGWAGITVLNLFAYRATKPTEMWEALDAGINIFGPKNDYFLQRAASFQVVVAAWGAQPDIAPRTNAVMSMFKAELAEPKCLGITKNGSPRHPLYVKGDQPLIPFEVAR